MPTFSKRKSNYSHCWWSLPHSWAAQYCWWPTRAAGIGPTLGTHRSTFATHSPWPLQGNLEMNHFRCFFGSANFPSISIAALKLPNICPMTVSALYLDWIHSSRCACRVCWRCSWSAMCLACNWTFSISSMCTLDISAPWVLHICWCYSFDCVDVVLGRPREILPWTKSSQWSVPIAANSCFYLHRITNCGLCRAFWASFIKCFTNLWTEKKKINKSGFKGKRMPSGVNRLSLQCKFDDKIVCSDPPSQSRVIFPFTTWSSITFELMQTGVQCACNGLGHTDTHSNDVCCSWLWRYFSKRFLERRTAATWSCTLCAPRGDSIHVNARRWFNSIFVFHWSYMFWCCRSAYRRVHSISVIRFDWSECKTNGASLKFVEKFKLNSLCQVIGYWITRAGGLTRIITVQFYRYVLRYSMNRKFG